MYLNTHTHTHTHTHTKKQAIKQISHQGFSGKLEKVRETNLVLDNGIEIAKLIYHQKMKMKR